jgi:hypothetical protein
MHQLADRVSAEEIGNWLLSEMSDHFGMTPNVDRERALANELKRWWQEPLAHQVDKLARSVGAVSAWSRARHVPSMTWR